MENSSQISNLQTELKYLDKLKCYRIISDSGVHPPGGWQMGGSGWGLVWVCGGMPMHVRMHTDAHACMHARTCMLNMLNMDASMSVAICNFYTCINVHVCMCVHVCGGTPPMPPDAPHPPAPSPELQGAQNTKIQ